MTEVAVSELKRAVEAQHGGTATSIQPVRVSSLGSQPGSAAPVEG